MKHFPKTDAIALDKLPCAPITMKIAINSAPGAVKKLVKLFMINVSTEFEHFSTNRKAVVF